MTALIILTYNNSSDTRNCIESILKHNTAPVKIIVVDNDSRPEEQQALRDAMQELLPGYAYIEAPAYPDDPVLPSAVLLQTGGNIGYGKGNNAGLALAYDDPEISHVMILNNDILFVEDIIPGLLDEMLRIDDCAIISPVLYKKGLKEYDYNCARKNISVGALISDNCFHYINKLLHRSSNAQRLYLLNENTPTEGVIPIELPSGSCMLADKNYFKSIGSFDPGTFMYFEENILYRKIKATGKRNYLSLKYKCIHLGASTTNTISNRKWLVIQAKNSEKYYIRNFSGTNSVMCLLHSLSVKIYIALFILQKKFKK